MSYCVAPADAFQVKTRVLSPTRLTVRPVTCGGAHDGAGAGAGAGVGAGVGVGAVGDGFELSPLPHATTSIAVTMTHDSPARFMDITPILTCRGAMAVPTSNYVQADAGSRMQGVVWLRLAQSLGSFVSGPSSETVPSIAGSNVSICRRRWGQTHSRSDSTS
jgi:hypothetical protein